MTITRRLKISRKVQALCLSGLFFWLTIIAADTFAIYIYSGVGTDEAKKLDKLISEHGYSAQALKNALYPGIDLNQVIRYCNRAKDEPIPGNTKEFKRCFTPLGVAFSEMGRSGKKERDSLLIDKMKVLVENGASVEQDPPVFFYAILDNRLDLAALILEKGIDVNKLRARVGIHPGFQNQGYLLAQVKPLVQTTCNVNEFRPDESIIDTSEYMYPIHTAAAAGSHEMFDLLLAHGADCTLKDNFGQTVMDWAKARGDCDTYFVQRIRQILPQTEPQRIQQAFPQPQRKGSSSVLKYIIICIILIALFAGIKALLKDSFKDTPSKRPAFLASRSSGVSSQSGRINFPNNKKIENTVKNDLVFSSVKPKAKSHFSLRDRSYFTLFVGLLPCFFLWLKWFLLSNVESPLDNPKIIGAIGIVSFLTFFSWLWAFLVSLRFVIDDLRKAEGSYTWIGYIGVLITLVLLILGTISISNGTSRLGQGSEASPVLTIARK